MVRSIYSANAAQHQNPVPNAAVHRGVLVTSAILGKESGADEYAGTVDRQIELAFDGLIAVLEAADASPQDVVKLDLFFADKSDRPKANVHWLRLWPDEHRRPARQAHVAKLPNRCLFQIVAMAVVGG